MQGKSSLCRLKSHAADLELTIIGIYGKMLIYTGDLTSKFSLALQSEALLKMSGPVFF